MRSNWPFPRPKDTGNIPKADAAEPFEPATLAIYQKMFNVTREERDEVLRVLAETEAEAVGSMGDDTPLPPMSSKVRVLYDYFRQQFAQVTNPPIDPLRERIVMSLETQIGPELNVFEARPENARRIVMNSPVLSQRKFRQILRMQEDDGGYRVIDLNRPESQSLADALEGVLPCTAVTSVGVSIAGPEKETHCLDG